MLAAVVLSAGLADACSGARQMGVLCEQMLQDTNSLLRSACSGVHPMGARCESFLQDTRFLDSGALLGEPFHG